ncbi:baseplate J/gp47 family protein [Sphingobium sp. AS12]|uniref:baseplate assembly protein n=1 Tax=Sphingobium sp. AS12 TaxID=2849495 RepID=UPI001C31D556|nr:baseplate J/gp47 family protein [Sphingobium sp. AS12]MBV2149282.1 baseplate J/gp47 family protein [Sphingobium sp. AS12]
MADATFTAVDLSRLPAPTIIEALDFETIYAAALAEFIGLVPDFVARESDPATKLLQVFAYRELILRQRINDALRGVMVAYAVGADLDNLGALLGVARLTLTPPDTVLNIAAIMESDTDFRRRIVLSPEGYSVAGPEGAYIYHALSAHPDVLDASATSPEPGHVLVSVLSRNGAGAASQALVDTVAAYLTDETRRPLTDYVTVQSAQIVNYTIVATLTTFSGPDGGVVIAAAQAKLAAYIADSHRIGRDITRSGIFAALHVEGVQNVTLTSPAADIVVARTQAPYCTGQAITYAGVGE